MLCFLVCFVASEFYDEILHTCFLSCTGSCTLVFALGAVEDIAKGEADTAIRLDFPLHRAASIVHGQVVATRFIAVNWK